MNIRLLKKLREQGRNKISIYSVIKTDDIVTGMSLGYNESEYCGLFEFGDTKEQVLKKAEHIYIENYLTNLK